ncbi:hypothetical protein KQX54_005291 [Cotesia glomerata]|uniref:Uncharacterized protein n=1 Tax=Cotesia glomerata TaxID=32391 RepID=A0AAV7I3W3_COTGL|nr:hypothetical protein KQX54_005291 [Cotesia glomerata]
MMDARWPPLNLFPLCCVNVLKLNVLLLLKRDSREVKCLCRLPGVWSIQQVTRGMTAYCMYIVNVNGNAFGLVSKTKRTRYETEDRRLRVKCFVVFFELEFLRGLEGVEAQRGAAGVGGVVRE